MQNNSDGGADGEGSQSTLAKNEDVHESTGVAAPEASQPRPLVFVAGAQREVISTLR